VPDTTVEMYRNLALNGLNDFRQSVYVADGPSSCLPPWFETTIPSTPCCTAKRASSPVVTPLTQTSILGLHSSFSQAMSRSQFSVGFAACEWKVTGPEGRIHPPFSYRPGFERLY